MLLFSIILGSFLILLSKEIEIKKEECECVYFYLNTERKSKSECKKTEEGVLVGDTLYLNVTWFKNEWK